MVSAKVVALIAAMLVTPHATLQIKMNSAHLYTSGSHVAVWTGATSVGNRDWIQGGIEIEYGDKHPYIFFETGHLGKQTSFIKRPTSFGTIARVKLVTIDNYWQVKINNTLYPTRIRINNPVVQIDVEKTGGGTVSVSVDGKVQH